MSRKTIKKKAKRRLEAPLSEEETGVPLHGVPLHGDDDDRSWHDLSEEEQNKVRRRLQTRMEEVGPVGPDHLAIKPNPVPGSTVSKTPRQMLNQFRCLGDDLNLPGPDVTVSPELITPEVAVTMLERNLKNRPYSKHHGLKLASAMRDGKWITTGDTICFTLSGWLADGQHRLNEIISTGMPQILWVVRGLSDEVWMYIDEGKPRSTAQKMQRKGVKNSGVVASAVKVIMQYFKGNTKYLSKYSNSCAYVADAYREAHPGIEWAATASTDVGKKLLPRGHQCVLLYLCSLVPGEDGTLVQTEESKEASRAFWVDGLAKGFNIVPGSPVGVLRSKFELDLHTSTKLGVESKVCLGIKAWNAQRQDKTPRSFQWRPNDVPNDDGTIKHKKSPIPQIIGVPRTSTCHTPKIDIS